MWPHSLAKAIMLNTAGGRAVMPRPAQMRARKGGVGENWVERFGDALRLDVSKTTAFWEQTFLTQPPPISFDLLLHIHRRPSWFRGGGGGGYETAVRFLFAGPTVSATNSPSTFHNILTFAYQSVPFIKWVVVLGINDAVYILFGNKLFDGTNFIFGEFHVCTWIDVKSERTTGTGTTR